MLAKLRNTSILTTNGISIKYTIQWSGEEISIHIPTGDVHFEEQEDKWNFYVPDNSRERALCYSLAFPEALTKLFRVPPAAREIISNVLSKPIYILDDILEAEGIGMVPDVAPPPRPAAENSPAERPSEQDVIAVEALSRSSRTQGTPASTVRRSHSPPAADEHNEPPERVTPEIGDWRTFSRDAYRDLLANVIRLASQTSLPHLNSMESVANNLHLEGFDHGRTFGLRSQGQIDHDTKIGAAGELFVSTVHDPPSGSEFNICNYRHLRYYPLLPYHSLTYPTGKVPFVGSWQYIPSILV